MAGSCLSDAVENSSAKEPTFAVDNWLVAVSELGQSAI